MTPERDCVKEALYSKRRVCSKVAGGNAGVKRVRGVYFRSNFQPTDGVESVELCDKSTDDTAAKR